MVLFGTRAYRESTGTHWNVVQPIYSTEPPLLRESFRSPLIRPQKCPQNDNRGGATGASQNSGLGSAR